MKIIGITGSSGSGKTTISEILKNKYNAHIIDADEIAKKLSKKGTMYLSAIVKSFGNEIVTKEGELKRKELANLIYEDDEKRNRLNELTFLYVVEEIKANINKLKGKDLIVIDAPLLFEGKLDQVCDFVIGVIANEEDKIRRICERDNIDEEIAKKRLSIQMSNEFIKENADYVIVNDASITDLEAEIRKIGI